MAVARGNRAMNIHDVLNCTELQAINSRNTLYRTTHVVKRHRTRRNKDMRRSLGRGAKMASPEGADSQPLNAQLHCYAS